jgi:ribosomal protein S11
MFIGKRIGEIARDYEINSIYVRIRAQTNSTGPGPGAHAVVKTLTKEGFKIINIVDTTKIPRGGPKKKGGRRGRRV